jgi:hypothetical protein
MVTDPIDDFMLPCIALMTLTRLRFMLLSDQEHDNLARRATVLVIDSTGMAPLSNGEMCADMRGVVTQRRTMLWLSSPGGAT